MLDLDFRFYFALFRRKLPVFLTVLALVSTAFVAAIVFWPVSYQATARILVESPQIPTDLAKSTVPTGAAEQFQIIQEDVLSRQSLLDLAERFGLDAGTPQRTDTEIVADMLARLGISPMPIGTGNGATATVFEISFKADHPSTAAEVVNDLVAMILKKDVALRTRRAQETVTFFNKETARLNAALRIVEGNILRFKNANINALPDSIEFRRTQQTNQQSRLLVLAQEKAGLNRQQLELQSRPLGVIVNPATPDEQTLTSLRQLLAQQRATFTETSPTIVALRSRIETLEKSLMATNQGAGIDTAGDGARQSPAMFDIRVRLEEIEDERVQLNQSLAALTASIEATPGIETALNSLQRDHQNLQAQYDMTVSRLAEASTGQQIELLLKGERLSLIESAVPPQKAQGPGQRVLLLGSALGAFVLALAVVVVPELLSKHIRRPAELVSRLQIVPFVTVPYIDRPARGHGGLRRLSKAVRSRLGFGGSRNAFPVPALAAFTKTRTGQ
ncbi:GumC family protein [Devosia sp. A369]